MHDSRYWWLRGGKTGWIVDQLTEIFTTLEVDAIGPGFGCLLLGPDTVKRHHDLIREALEISAELEPTGVELGRTYLKRTDPRTHV